MTACTLWFDSLGPWNWHACCVQHDFDYVHQIGEALANVRLERCVDAVLPGMGVVMWLGVTLFGGIWYALARREATK